MKRIIFIMSAFGILLAAPAALTSCQEDAPEINYTINITVVNDFTKVVEAINNGSLKNEEAIKALTDAIDKMSADQATKLQSIVDVLNSVNTTLETKLAAVEAAMKAQTLSLETKMDLLDKAIKALTTSMEDKMDLLDKAVKALTSSIDQMNTDQAAKLQALTEALTSVGSTLEAKLALIEAAVNAQTLSMENKMDLLDKAIKALTTSIDQMNADQAAKLQALTEALTSVGSSLEAKLALIEAAVNAQTLSLEGKLDLLRQAIEALPDYTERLAAIETAIKGLPDYTDKLDAIKVAIEALPDYGEKFDAVTTALDSLRQNLKASEKDLAEKVAGVSAAIKSLIESVDSGNESAAAALEKIIAKLEELKAYLGGSAPSDEYVDLDVSVKWATRNLGADKPTDVGYYFAWGETERRYSTSWSTYKWMTPGESKIKYITKYTVDDKLEGAIWYDDTGNFIGDGKTVLEPEDDAAASALGNPWRMPTYDEFMELKDRCNCEYTEQDGVNGLLVTSHNGNSIFFPEVKRPIGFDHDTDVSQYWTSSIYDYDSGEARVFWFTKSGIMTNTVSERMVGFPIRPVRP